MEVFTIGFFVGSIVTIMGVLYCAYMAEGKCDKHSGDNDSDRIADRECGSMDISSNTQKGE